MAARAKTAVTYKSNPPNSALARLRFTFLSPAASWACCRYSSRAFSVSTMDKSLDSRRGDQVGRVDERYAGGNVDEQPQHGCGDQGARGRADGDPALLDRAFLTPLVGQLVEQECPVATRRRFVRHAPSRAANGDRDGPASTVTGYWNGRQACSPAVAAFSSPSSSPAASVASLIRNPPCSAISSTLSFRNSGQDIRGPCAGRLRQALVVRIAARIPTLKLSEDLLHQVRCAELAGVHQVAQTPRFEFFFAGEPLGRSQPRGQPFAGGTFLAVASARGFSRPTSDRGPLLVPLPADSRDRPFGALQLAHGHRTYLAGLETQYVPVTMTIAFLRAGQPEAEGAAVLRAVGW